MPRTSTDEEKPKKRVPKKRMSSTAPRKRAPRKTTAKRAVGKPASEKRSVEPNASATSEKRIETRDTERPARKAPTPIATRQSSKKAKRNQILIASAIMIVGIGSSVMVGMTDTGQIDVNQAIEARNERLRSGQLGESDTQRVIVPAQNTQANRLPDGGLVGLGVGSGAAPAPEPATTTATSSATSTDASATTTDSDTDSTETEATVDESEEGNDSEPEANAGGDTTTEPLAGDNLATEEAPTDAP